MKRKSLFVILSLLFTTLIASCSNKNNVNNTVEHEKIKHNCELEDLSGVVSRVVDRTDVTMEEFARFLENKKEHYPLSDQFTERYQQNSGGYIENGPAAGIVVDKQQYSPNQKWHFFHSWMYPSIEDGSLTWEASARSRVYVNLKCPELLLWIYEASGVNPTKVREAMKVAEDYKVTGGNISTMASNMRKIVLWDDILVNVLEFLDSNPDDGVTRYPVTINTNSDFSVTSLKSQYEEGSKVTFTINVTNKNKELEEVKINGEVLAPVSGTTYEFTMPANSVSITVTLKTIEGGSDTPTPNPNPGDVDADYKIVFDMGTSSRSKELKTADAVYATFNLVGENSPRITSISDVAKVYGGAYGGSGDTAWKFGDVLKLGTQSVTGGFTMILDKEVTGLIITGYTGAKSGKVRVGDSTSTDWTSDANDNKTSLFVTTNMSLANAETAVSREASTISVSFASTNNVRIETAENVPFYIESIKFIYSE